jgi:hypothetical protein
LLVNAGGRAPIIVRGTTIYLGTYLGTFLGTFLGTGGSTQ